MDRSENTDMDSNLSESMVLMKKLQLENSYLDCSQQFHSVVLCYTLYGSIALQLQNKTRVEPVKGGFMKESGEYFGNTKGEGKMCRKTYILALK